MTVLLAVGASRHPNIRGFDPARDLAALADLVEVAFGRELALTESRLVDDMRQAASLGPVLWATQTVLGLFDGFVWCDGQQMVGNVSLAREKWPETWTIANVAVLPEYRRRGIARQLVEQAIAHIRRHGGKRILLQVRADNNIAKRLYQGMGFVTFDTWKELYLSTTQWPIVLARPQADLRRPRLADAEQIYNLLKASTAPGEWLRRPPSRSGLRRGFLWHCGQIVSLLTSGKQRIEYLAQSDDGLDAFGALDVRLVRGTAQLSLYVHPRARGERETVLLEALLRRADRLPRHSIRWYLSKSHKEAESAATRFGFRVLRTLDQMSLELP